MKIGSSILLLVLFFGATFYVLGSLTTNAAQLQARLHEIQAMNEQLEAQLQQQNQNCQRDIQVWSQNTRQLEEQIHSQSEELALLQQSLDAERAARMEAEETIETLKVQRVEQPYPPRTQNKSIRSLATSNSESIRNWAKVILTSSLILLVLVSGYSVRAYGKAKLHRLLKFLNRMRVTAVEPNLVQVLMTRRQCQDYSRWQRIKQQETYQSRLSQHEQSSQLDQCN